MESDEDAVREQTQDEDQESKPRWCRHQSMKASLWKRIVSYKTTTISIKKNVQSILYATRMPRWGAGSSEFPRNWTSRSRIRIDVGRLDSTSVSMASKLWLMSEKKIKDNTEVVSTSGIGTGIEDSDEARFCRARSLVGSWSRRNISKVMSRKQLKACIEGTRTTSSLSSS